MTMESTTGVERTTVFTFKPLRHAKSIRLLHLLPSDPSGPVHATLEEYQLDECAEFEALSYCWGEPVLSRIMYLNGLPFGITENLNSALSHLVLPERTRRLWVDALSINQNDNKEKGVQVWIMGEIFARATRVLVWFGNGTKATDLAIHKLKRFWKNVDERGWASPNQYCSSFLDLRSSCQNSDLRTLTNEFETLGLYVLFVHDWWRRLWIVQEFAMAKSILMVYGMEYIDWTIPCNSVRLYLRALAVAGRDLLGPERDIPGKCILAVTNARLTFQGALTNKYFEESVRGLLPWVLKFQKCGDDRDRAYAILGLIFESLPGAAKKNFRPDYALTVEQVYKEFTKEHVYGRATYLPYFPVFVLRSVGLVNHSNPQTPSSLLHIQDKNYLPSWSFDYRPSDFDYGPRRVFEYILRKLDSPQTDSPLFTFDESKNALILKGARNGSISHMFTIEYPRNGGLTFIRRALLEVKRQLLEHSNHFLNESLENILAHLLSNQFELDPYLNPVEPEIAWDAFEQQVLDENAAFYSKFTELHEQLQVPSSNTRGWTWTPKARDLTNGVIPLPATQKLAWDCCRLMHELLQSCVTFITADGLVGLAPKTIANLISKEIQIFALAGANNAPFMLLPWISDVRKNHFSLLGFAYLHGVDWYKNVWLPIEEAQGWDTVYII